LEAPKERQAEAPKERAVEQPPPKVKIEEEKKEVPLTLEQ
jgi:hypothetical protein